MPRKMTGVLASICANKTQEVSLLNRDLDSYRRDPAFGDVRDFYGALAKHGRRFIMECKRISPSQGVLRDDFSLEAIADAYAGIADVISVLTDREFFGGDLAHIGVVRARVCAPVLRKDFIIDAIQLYQAWAAGADAVLLMLSVLTDEEYVEFSHIAEKLKLGVLTEVHTDDELTRAIALKAKVIGINNRDLTTLEIDLNVTKTLSPRIPKDRLIISESGIRSHQDVLSLSPFAKGFLVGSSLMSKPNLALAARELVFGAIKVCGLTNPQDAIHAFQHGAQYGGLIFANRSPRAVSTSQAQLIVDSAPMHFVGVFVEQSLSEIVNIQRKLSLFALQLHGSYSEQDVHALRELCPETQIWQVQKMLGDEPIQATKATRLLLDSAVPANSSNVPDSSSVALDGGNGTSFNWQALTGYEHRSNLILAGGLTPQNIVQAKATGVGMLDVNSGVESFPGKKSVSQLIALFDALRTIENPI